MRCIRVLVVVLFVIASTLVGLTSPALACSCAGAPFEVNEEFGLIGVEGFDAAFVGTLVDHSMQGQEIAWQFDIDYVVRGSLATPISVITASDGGACGFENLAVGDERAVGLTDRGGRWESGLCSIDLPEAVADVDFRAEPTIAAPSESDGLSTGSGLGLGAVGLGFAAVLAAIAGAVAFSRRSPSGDFPSDVG